MKDIRNPQYVHRADISNSLRKLPDAWIGVDGLGEKRGLCNALAVMSSVPTSVELQIRGPDSVDHLENILGFQVEEYVFCSS